MRNLEHLGNWTSAAQRKGSDLLLARTWKSSSDYRIELYPNSQIVVYVEHMQSSHLVTRFIDN